MNLSASRDHVHDLYGVEVVVQLHLGGHEASLVLHEVKCVYHVVGRDLPVHANAEEAYDRALQRVIHGERGSLPLFHVEGDLLEPAHVEEGLVLNGGQSWMVQEVTKHEGSRLVLLVTIVQLLECTLGLVGLLLLRGQYGAIVFQGLDLVVARLWVQPAFHEDVEEEADGGVVAEVRTDVDGPRRADGQRRRSDSGS